MDRYCDMDPNVTTRYLEVDVGQIHAAIMMDGTIFMWRGHDLRHL